MSTFKNIVITESIQSNELFYMPGDIIIDGIFFGAGYITTAKTNIYVDFPLNKIIHDSVSSITIEDTSVTLRQGNMYIYGNGDQNVKWDGTFSFIYGAGSYYLRLEAKTALSSATNNDTVGVRIDGYTLKFN